MLVPVILSGGTGSRLWPVSREMHPKPFIKLNDGQSLLQKTMLRASNLPDVAEILTATNREYYFKTLDEYVTMGIPIQKNHFLLEPFSRNTAPAIGLAAFYALDQHGAESTLLVLPADHLIEHQPDFNQAVGRAYTLARQGRLVTFGIAPTRPETGFGYIKLKPVTDDQGNGSVEKFIEKPSYELTVEYCAAKNYLWNSGIFCFRAEVILAQLEKCSPELWQLIKCCWEASKHSQLNKDRLDAQQTFVDMETFKNIPDVSIDYAVMEKSDQVAVVPSCFAWNDIGSWNAISDTTEKDAAGNAVVGDALLVDVSGSFIQSENRLVAAIGVKDLIVVDTADALLVADKSRAQEVKKIVGQLRENNHHTYKTHRTMFRPWGSYTVLEEGELFKIKRIIVKPGAALSLQLHHHRSEHWVVVSGMAHVTKGTEIFMLQTNMSTFIPIGCQHRLANPGVVDLVLIEVQTGEYLGEDDIVRLDDQYGRANKEELIL